METPLQIAGSVNGDTIAIINPNPDGPEMIYVTFEAIESRSGAQLSRDSAVIYLNDSIEALMRAVARKPFTPGRGSRVVIYSGDW